MKKKSKIEMYEPTDYDIKYSAVLGALRESEAFRYEWEGTELRDVIDSFWEQLYDEEES